MKKNLFICIFLVIFIVSAVQIPAQEMKYEETQFDLFGVKFKHPADWNLEVKPEYIKFTSPDNERLQLVFYQNPERYEGNLEDYFNDYKDNLAVDYKAEILSAETFEIAGMGAYYIKGTEKNGDLGHVIFVKDESLYALALLTPKNDYSLYEPVLMKAAESLDFMTANQ